VGSPAVTQVKGSGIGAIPACSTELYRDWHDAGFTHSVTQMPDTGWLPNGRPGPSSSNFKNRVERTVAESRQKSTEILCGPRGVVRSRPKVVLNRGANYHGKGGTYQHISRGPSLRLQYRATAPFRAI